MSMREKYLSVLSPVITPVIAPNEGADIGIMTYKVVVILSMLRGHHLHNY